jgi:carboxymethylenebutenolidase
MNEFQSYLINEFVDDYKDGFMSRRDLLKRVLYITGGVASTASVLSLLGCGGNAAPASTAPSSAAAAAKPSSAAPSAQASAAAPSASAKPAASAAASASAKPAASAPASAAAKPAASAPPASTPTGPRSPVSVPANDPAVDQRDITFPGAGGTTLLGYEARPKNASGALPLVLLIPMNVGLEDHMKDVTRRYGKAGYLALTVDPLSRQGGTSKVERAQVGAIMSQTGPDTYAGDYKSAMDYYAKQGGALLDRVGISGFCIGGTLTYRSIIAIPEIRAAVPFYGSVPPLDQVGKIKAAIWGVYSADPQDNANKDQDKLDEALKSANVVHTFKTYPGTQHAFHDDTGPRYVQDQALAAWKDAQDWFGKYLKG